MSSENTNLTEGANTDAIQYAARIFAESLADLLGNTRKKDDAKRLNLTDNQTLWDAEDIAAYTGYKPRYIAETISQRPDFPKPISRIKGKWVKADIIKYYTKR